MKKSLFLAIVLATAAALMTSCVITPVGPSAPSPIASATDMSYSVTTGGTGSFSNWFSQSTYTNDGVDAAESGSISASSSTWFQITVSGYNYIGFYWKVSSESFDHLTVSVDGSASDYISGAVDWSFKEIYLGGGTHTIKWTYSKDSSVSTGLDTGWVDQISVYNY